MYRIQRSRSQLKWSTAQGGREALCCSTSSRFFPQHLREGDKVSTLQRSDLINDSDVRISWDYHIIISSTQKLFWKYFCDLSTHACVYCN